jgi:uncharacterized membrane protein YjfL (UPF0719 family)
MNIEQLQQYGIYVLYAFVFMAFMLSLKYALNFIASKHYNSDEVLSEGNLAAGMRRTGAQLGLAISFMGILSGVSSGTLLNDLALTAVYGLAALIFILSSLLFTDKMVIAGIDNTKAIKNNNISVGIAEFGMLVGTGIIAYSSFSGESGGMISSVCYFLIGQATLVALILVYEKLVLRNFNIINSIGKGDVASGIYLAGKIIAYSLILKSAIMGNGADVTISEMAIEFVSLAIIGMIFLYVFEYLVDLLIITSSNVKSILAKNQFVLSLQLSVAKIGVALILSSAIL